GLLRGGNGAVVVGGLGVLTDGIHHVHTLGDGAESGVVGVQAGGVLMDNEELGGGGVGVIGAGHGDGAPLMGQGVVPAVGGELAHDLMLGAAGAVALGAAGL